ncbi:MAG: PEP/pyruvate-binding domain-containing protein [Stackebrandtia sp.]
MSTINMPLVMEFRDVDAERPDAVGGKAANLGVLAAAGFRVPPGVCLTTEAYARVAAGAGLDRLLDALADADARQSPGLAAQIREAIMSAPVPDDIAEAMRARADGPVAVRSSATAEDLPHASFAGQQDTYLNVVGGDAVLDAVRRCWASLWTDRAVAYRAANGIDHRRVRLAVVIQRMVDAAVAGVGFTANPVTGRRREVVVDAAPGLGESVVSGTVNPDHFVVDPDGDIVERRLGDKRTAVVASPEGGTRLVEGADAAQPCLSDDQIREIATLGLHVEEHYGSPQDIEWVFDSDGVLWLTQARPITTLYPLPTPPTDGRDDALRVYFSVAAGQGLYRPITPMGLSAFRMLGSSVARMFGFPVSDPPAGPPVFTEAGQRVFIDVTGALRSRAGRVIAPRLLDFMEARSAVILRDLLRRPELSLTQRSRLPFVRRVARIMFRYRIPPRVVRAMVSPAAARRRISRLREEFAAALRLPQDATTSQRLDYVERILGELTMPTLPKLAPGPACGFLMLGVAHRLLRDRARPGELQTVMRGLPHNVTVEMDLDLWRLACEIRADAEATELLLSTPPAELAARRELLPAAVSGPLEEFLARYGFRAVGEIDLGMPRWSDDPTHILGVLANYLRLEDDENAPSVQFARGEREAEEAIAQLSARVGPLRGRLVRFALGRARELAGLRELPKFCIVTALAASRAQLRIVGAELAASGAVEAADDVFFLDLAEARAGGDLRERVADRRARYERELRRKHVPRVLLSDGTEPEAIAAAPDDADGRLRGTPASAGVVVGTARVITDPVGARLEPGEILVAPSTDPGWTPLFLTAGGLVMEMGGANSHGAVVAREYGIPAVVGVRDAVAGIVTGQRVAVDGTAGTVALDVPEEVAEPS